MNFLRTLSPLGSVLSFWHYLQKIIKLLSHFDIIHTVYFLVLFTLWYSIYPVFYSSCGATKQRLAKQYRPHGVYFEVHSGCTSTVVIFLGGWGAEWVQEVANNSCQMWRVPWAHPHSHRQWNACEEPCRKWGQGSWPLPLSLVRHSSGAA